MYWNPLDVLFVWFSVILNFYISRSERISKSLKLISCVSFNAGYLLALKIFVSSGAGSASNEALALSALGLPLGISFITFQQISFVVDQAEGRDREPSFSRYLFFVMFFPQLISGPIVKHSRLIPQIYRETFKQFSMSFASVGFCYFAIGLSKKVFIADPLATANEVFFAETSNLLPIEVWMNAFMYTFRIYFDFSAYADMAVGLGYIFGIQLPRNFNSPYKSTNIAQFWRIWHISLYNFFKQYLFKPLLRLQFFQKQVLLAIVIVMLLSAIWHGVGWGYMMWGAGHAILLICYKTLGRWINFGYFNNSGPVAAFVWRWLCIGMIFLLVTFLWLPFATNDYSLVVEIFSRMFDFARLGIVSDLPYADRSHLLLLAVAAAISFFGPNSHQIALGFRNAVWPLYWASFLIVASIPAMISRSANPIPFLYFQF